jgi:carboxymethylenebutenolidase
MAGLKVKEEETQIRDSSGTDIKTFIARPDDKGKHPAVIVVHEIWGLENNIRSIARRLAQEGFVAYAPHLFSGEGPYMNLETIEQAMRVFWTMPRDKMNDEKAVAEVMAKMTEDQRNVVQKIFFNRKEIERKAVSKLSDIMGVMNKDPAVNTGHIGATGFCFGGGLVFQFSTQSDVKGTVVFYGANPDPVQAVEKIKAPVLALYGGEDKNINGKIPEMMEQVVKFGKDFHMKIYRNAMHAFFNDTRPTYNREAADDAWKLALDFFRKNLGE